jgi:hypothetical protein
MFSNNSMNRLAVSNAFTITGCPSATLGSTPSSVAVGGVVTATWSGVCFPTSTDWIGLYQTSASDVSYAAWIWSNGSANGSAPLTIPGNLTPGAYELRMFTNNSGTRLAVANAFTVTP